MHATRRFLSRGRATIIAVLAGLAGVLVLVSPVGAAPLAAKAAPSCQRTFVPSFPWSAAFWTRAFDSRPAPGVMLLDVTGTGAGNVPVPHFQGLVRQAHRHGVEVLGYSSTEYGQRPASAVEADARHYRAWYRIDGMFLDLAAAGRGQLPYYRKLASYIRRINPRAVIWLNPGAYPDQAYLQVANVLVAFEGPYAEYRGLQVPGWVRHYRASRFAHVIHNTPLADLARAVRLGRQRRAGYMYVTDQGGNDPYSALPSYWTQEVATVAARC
ncbi:MAG TPA: spherulation-specific family 4 protein [Streptosporangiaceae bacterium]|nr:spherulation-specific family 4 protein [Streptosporangiaceae bacterium]